MQAGLQADQGPAAGMDARVVFDAIAAGPLRRVLTLKQTPKVIMRSHLEGLVP